MDARASMTLAPCSRAGGVGAERGSIGRGRTCSPERHARIAQRMDGDRRPDGHPFPKNVPVVPTLMRQYLATAGERTGDTIRSHNSARDLYSGHPAHTCSGSRRTARWGREFDRIVPAVDTWCKYKMRNRVKEEAIPCGEESAARVGAVQPEEAQPITGRNVFRSYFPMSDL